MKSFPVAAKVLTLLAIIGALMLVLFRIGGLNDERQRRAREAQNSIEQAQAGRQALLGPVLRTECHETWDEVDRSAAKPVVTQNRRDFVHEVTPERLAIASQVKMVPRHRGIFTVNTYVASTTLTAHWVPTAPAGEKARSKLVCSAPYLMVAVTDSRGLRAVRLSVDGQSTPVLPGTRHGKHKAGFHADLPAAADKPFDAVVSLDLVGTGDFAIAPIGDENTVAVKADWPHPAFGGRFLPLNYTLTDQGFDATWAISSLATGAGRDYFRGAPLCAGVSTSDRQDESYETAANTSDSCVETFGVAFFDPVNPYSLSDRALKYGLLFVALSFVAVGMIEVLRRLRVHPMQYLLVGSALSLFFLLLLSLSEHLPFHWAYLAASAACVSLLTFYGTHVLGGWRAGLGFGAGIAALYGALFALLQMEQTALIIGSVLLFAVLTLVMVLTRRVDWYALVGASIPPAPAAADTPAA